MQQVTLKPGDYVATEGMTDDQYYWVVKAFENAGCLDKYDNANKRPRMDYLEWYLGCLCATNTVEHNARELSIEQVLNATNADRKKTDMQDWAPADLFKHGDGEWGQREGDCYVTRTYKDGKLIKTTHHELNDLTKSSEDADMHITDQLHKALQIRDEAQARYEQVLAEHRETYPWLAIEERKQPTDDMSDPANWRAGDWLECVANKADLTAGRLYQVKRMARNPIIDDNDEKDVARLAEYFRFHSRP